MIWYKNPFFSEKAKKKKEELILHINEQDPVHSIKLIVLPRTECNQLEILSLSRYLKDTQREGETMIVGAACSMNEARELAKEILELVYQTTGSADIRSYLEKE